MTQKVKLAGKTVRRKDKYYYISILNVFPSEASDFPAICEKVF